MSHELTPTGAPRIAWGLSTMLGAAGARVTLTASLLGLTEVDLKRDAAELGGGGAPADFSISLVSPGSPGAAAFDSIFVNSVTPQSIAWIAAFRASTWGRNHSALLWYVHESRQIMELLGEGVVAAALDAIAEGHVDGVLYLSWSTHAYWTERMRERNAQRVVSPPFSRVLHWGLSRSVAARIDAARSDPSALSLRRTQLGIGASDFVVVVLGSIERRKGQAGALSAFMRARRECGSGGDASPWHLVVAGKVQEDSTADLLRRDPGVVHVLPPTSEPETILGIADAYVSNSQSPGESWGLSTLEALASGGPVVLASAVGGVLEQVQHGSGALLHPPAAGGVEEAGAGELALAAHLCSAFRDPAASAAMARRGRASSLACFGPDVLEVETTQLLAAVLSRPPRPRPTAVPLSSWRRRAPLVDPAWHCAVVVLGTSVALLHRRGGALCAGLPDPGQAGATVIARVGIMPPLPDTALIGGHAGAGMLVVVGSALSTQGAGPESTEAYVLRWDSTASPSARSAASASGTTRVALPSLPPRCWQSGTVIITMEAAAAGTSRTMPITLHVIAGVAGGGSHAALELHVATLSVWGHGLSYPAVWELLPSLPIPADGAAGGGAGGSVYVFGGSHDVETPACAAARVLLQDGGPCPRAAALAPSSAKGHPAPFGAAFRFSAGHWERLLDAPVPVAQAAVAFSPSGGAVFLVGGRRGLQGRGSGDASVVQEYSVASGEWTVHWQPEAAAAGGRGASAPPPSAAACVDSMPRGEVFVTFTPPPL